MARRDVDRVLPKLGTNPAGTGTTFLNDQGDWTSPTGVLLPDVVDNAGVKVTISVPLSDPGAGASSERFGAGSAAAGASGLSVGNGSVGSGTSTLLGTSTADAGNSGIAIGVGATLTGNQQLSIGSGSQQITNTFIGKGSSSSSPQGFTVVQGTGASGVDIVATDLYLAPGKSTGAANPAVLHFQASSAGGSSATQQSMSTIVDIKKTPGLTVFGFINHNGQTRLTSQLDKVNATFTTAMTVQLVTGRNYRFKAILHLACDAVGGWKLQITGNAVTSIIYQLNATNNTTNAFTANSRVVALSSSVGVSASGVTVYVEIEGFIIASGGGGYNLQFAQNAASGTSSMLIGSYMEFEDYS